MVRISEGIGHPWGYGVEKCVICLGHEPCALGKACMYLNAFLSWEL